MTSDTDSALLKEATPSTTDTSTHSLSSSSQPQHPSSSLTSFNPNMTTIQVTPPPSTSGNKFKLFFFKLFHKSHHGGDQQQQHLKRSTSFFDRFKKNNHSNGTTSYQTVSSKSDLSKKTLTQEENEKKTTHELSMSLNDLCDVVVEDKILNEQHQRPLNEHTTTSTTTSTTPFFQYIEFLFLFNANSNTLSVYNEDELKKMVPYHVSLDVTIPSLQQAFHLDDHGDDLSCVLSVQQKNMCYVFTGSHDNTILQYEYQKTCKEQPFKLIHTFQDEKNTVECLSHYKNHFLLSGSRDKMIRLRKIQSNSDQEQLTCSTLLARLEGHTSWIQSVYGGEKYLSEGI
nr:unnamed protein product [Naegleria fowleri]